MIEPSTEERARMQGIVDALVAAVQAEMDRAKISGIATVQGSVAKDTWLAGSTDIDLFLLLDPETPQEALKDAAFSVGSVVLDKVQTKYAQHPYLVGEFEGMQVDLVPAYRVADASDHMSAVDRTPFHTAWVLANSDAEMRQEIRFAKQWCKGVGIYGADTATGGFSGYLVEVLVIAHAGFDGFLDWLMHGTPRVAVANDLVEDDVSALVVVDPVDAARNCGAAVQANILALAEEAAEAYRENPSDAFLFPAPARAEPELCRSALAAGRVWLGLSMMPTAERLDIVFPQFQRAARTLHEAFERAGFPVHRHQVSEHDGEVRMQWLVDDVTLPDSFSRRGPQADRKPNADKFRQKWLDHPDAARPVYEQDGALWIDVKETAPTPALWLRRELPRFQGGKHVVAALKNHTIHEELPSGSWAPAVTDFILGRRPWQR